MPEMWLPYGQVEVPLNIRAENLGEVVEPEVSQLDEQIILEKTREISLKDGGIILVCDSSDSSLKVLDSLLVTNGDNVSGIKSVVPEKHFSAVKKVCDRNKVHVQVLQEASDSIEQVDGVQVKLPKIFGEHENWFLISKSGLDPLFGFSGGPASLVRAFSHLLSAAFGKRVTDEPTPASETEPDSFASMVADKLNRFVSLEVVSHKNGIADLFIGDLNKTHNQAKMKVSSYSEIKVEYSARGILVSPGGQLEDRTLSSSLNSLWNALQGVKEGGVIGVIAECSGGVGSEALRLAVSGRLNLKEVTSRKKYVYGLEELVYLNYVQKKFDMIMVSTLPHYYVESILGFKSANSVGDALSYILSTSGSRSKFHVVPCASHTLLRTV